MKKVMKKAKHTRRPMTSLKTLVVAMASLAMVSTGQADVEHKQIGDLEIFKPAEGGGGTVVMMLDISGSMGITSIPEDYSTRFYYSQTLWDRCNFKNGGTIARIKQPFSQHLKDKDGNIYHTVTYDIEGCPDLWYGSTSRSIEIQPDGTVTRGYIDRLSRMKIALIGSLAEEGLIDNNHRVGAGHFSVRGQGRTGRVHVPAEPLTKEHRKRLATYISKLQWGGMTPSATAYAEAGAYMLGSTTAPNAHSGFSESDASTKNSQGTRYNSPLSDTKQCGGSGIFFLTDGQPNGGYNTWDVPSHTNIETVMKNSLNGVSVSQDYGMEQGVFDYPQNVTRSGHSGWRYIGAYAKKIKKY